MGIYNRWISSYFMEYISLPVSIQVFFPVSVGTTLGRLLSLIIGHQDKLLYNTEITQASLA